MTSLPSQWDISSSESQIVFAMENEVYWEPGIKRYSRVDFIHVLLG